MATNEKKSKRVILQVNVRDLPGPPENRHNFLGDLFCTSVLRRTFQNDVRKPHYDHVHIPPEFDTERAVRKWFILDLNVYCRFDKAEVQKIPHEVYSVSHPNDEWYVSLPKYTSY